METVIKVLNDIETNLYSKTTVKSLSRPETSDHARGKIEGKIELLYKIRQELGLIKNDIPTTKK